MLEKLKSEKNRSEIAVPAKTIRPTCLRRASSRRATFRAQRRRLELARLVAQQSRAIVHNADACGSSDQVSSVISVAGHLPSRTSPQTASSPSTTRSQS